MQANLEPRDTLDGLLSPALFKALGDPNRLALLLRLAAAGGPATVSALRGCCERDLSVVSRHLARLREAGIVVAERRGREVHYQLTSDLASTLRAIADALDACCPPAACAPGACCPPGTCGMDPKEGET
ncbi:helix-turn-helix transcriptional regulator [bacterium]|nr:helix-turn-helix transcriptional regulator [bacterium]